MTTTILRVCGTSFITGRAGVEMGCGGPNLKSAYLRIAGPDVYLWGTKNDGSTGGGVDAGIDPGTYVAELAGYTGLQVIYPAGLVTPGARAAIIAAMLVAQPWCTSATVAAADQANGYRAIEVIGDYSSIAPGTRTWASRGAAGQFGMHVFRAAPDVVGALNIPITLNIANAMATPPANAQFWGIGLQLGPVVSAIAANRPRLYLRAGGTAVDPAGSVMLFDFGQIPASQIVANSLAMITITPVQAAALRAALTGIGGAQLWICAKNTLTTEYVGLPTGGGWNGQLADNSIRVDVATSNDPTTPAPVAWNSAGMLSFGFLLSARLFYEVDPPGDANSFPIFGSLRNLAGFPNDVLLPDTETLMTALPGIGYDNDYKIYQTEIFITDGAPGIRQCYDQGGDSPGLDMTGATTILDIGETNTSGVITTLQPTGDSAIPVPPTISYRFKGTGSTGRGALDPLNNTAIEPNDYISLVDGSSPREFDYAAPGGNPAVAFADPIADPATFPDNLPALRTTFVHLADTVELVPPPPPPPPPTPPTPTPGRTTDGGGGGGGPGMFPSLPVNSYVIIEGPIGWLVSPGVEPVLVKILTETDGGPTGTTVTFERITEEEALVLIAESQQDIDLVPPSIIENAATRLRRTNPQSSRSIVPRGVFSTGKQRIFSKKLMLPRGRGSA